MKELTVKLDFPRSFAGKLETKGVTADIGYGADGRLGSYDMLLGALGCCFYYHVLHNAEKMKLTYDRVAFTIHGTLRQAVPDTMETVEMDLTAYGVQEKEGFSEAVKKSTGECSVHATLSKVADISIRLHYT